MEGTRLQVKWKVKVANEGVNKIQALIGGKNEK